jgi:hypothetical protein
MFGTKVEFVELGRFPAVRRSPALWGVVWRAA